MKQLASFFVLFAVLCGLPAVAAEPAKESIFTATQLNGRGWLGLDEHCKVFYVIGLENGLRWASTALQDGKIFAQVYIPAASRFDEIAKGVDMFYADPANANVPVYDAFRIFKMRLEGTSKAEIERLTEEARKFAHAETAAEH